jgi:hypothetical protein
MRLPLTSQNVTALARGLSSDPQRRSRRDRSVSRTAVLPGQGPQWRPPSRLAGLLERVVRVTPVLA